MEEDPFYTAFFSALNIGSSKVNFWAILSLASRATTTQDQHLIIAWLGYNRHATKYRDFRLLIDIPDKWEETWLASFERTAYVGRNKTLKSAYSLLR